MQASLKRLLYAGLMAAMVFVATTFFKIEIATPAGYTMIKTGNILCILAGFLLGPVYGGLAAGIGSGLYDLFDPKYAASAPFTFVFFFLMAFTAGWLNKKWNADLRSVPKMVVFALCGAMLYWFLTISKSVITLMLAGSAFVPALVANGTKMLTSLINAIVAVVFSVLLARPIRKALDKNNLMDAFK